MPDMYALSETTTIKARRTGGSLTVGLHEGLADNLGSHDDNLGNNTASLIQWRKFVLKVLGTINRARVLLWEKLTMPSGWMQLFPQMLINRNETALIVVNRDGSSLSSFMFQWGPCGSYCCYHCESDGCAGYKRKRVQSSGSACKKRVRKQKSCLIWAERESR